MHFALFGRVRVCPYTDSPVASVYLMNQEGSGVDLHAGQLTPPAGVGFCCVIADVRLARCSIAVADVYGILYLHVTFPSLVSPNLGGSSLKSDDLGLGASYSL